MKRLLILLALLALLPAPALAASGEPRLLQGTLEWPPTLAGEPIVIVRADDGRVYAVDIAEAVRQSPGGLRSGGRVAFLGVEGARPHEMTALVIADGDAAALARTLSQRLASTASLEPVAPPTVIVMPPAVAPAAPPAPTPEAAPAPTQTPAPAAALMPAPAPAPPPAPTPAAVEPAPATPPKPETPVTATPGDRGQWGRVDGRVESIEGNTLVLRDSSGALVTVDISNLNREATKALRPGEPVSVYGYPQDRRFEAAGYIEVDPSHPEPPRARRR